MSSKENKVKLYKNPHRSKLSDVKPYVPQWQQMGIEPEERMTPPASMGHTARQLTKAPFSRDNPRAPRPLMRQPYAEAVVSPVGRGRGLLPNVGNNLEQTWSSVDGEIVDDISTPPDTDPHMMIDNNDYVSAQALGITEDGDSLPVYQTEAEDVVEIEEANFMTQNQLQHMEQEDHSETSEQYLSDVVNSLEEGEYLLLVNGSAICSGPLEGVQDQARGLLFGEHPLCEGNPMPVDDIVVLKKVKLKVGLFLE
jgi:hypothetical protein